MESDTEYEKKFAEMQRFVPFLESMIKRLESTCTGDSNPREAQLTKIKSLRNLLHDRTKKMKMDNLLKCEQVMLNLYSKVGEADRMMTAGSIIPEVKIKDEMIEQKQDLQIVREEIIEQKQDLQIVREKLKTVTVCEAPLANSPASLPDRNKQTPPVKSQVYLPLYERRPRRLSRSKSISPRSHLGHTNSHSPSSRVQRKYTRVLCSPEPDRKWSTASPQKSPHKVYDSHGNPLFQRRSPRRRKGRSHSRSKSKKKLHKKYRSPSDRLSIQDVNITLNVPEESLNSLSASNIFSRIVNCNKDDVDIKHLRELREQIVSELKQTGANHDISDYILKSYKKKKKKKTRVQEIEEGELSDSESEQVEKIYGNLTDDYIEEKPDQSTCNTVNIEKTKATVEESTIDSPKIKISLILSNPADENSIENSSAGQTNPTDSPKPTTTFLLDVAHSAGINEPNLDNAFGAGARTKAPFFYGELQIDEVASITNKSTNQEPSHISNLDGKQTAESIHDSVSPSLKAQYPHSYLASDVKAGRHSSAIKYIANSIEAVTKPRELYMPNVELEKEMSELLYKDLSPIRSLPCSDALKGSHLNETKVGSENQNITKKGNQQYLDSNQKDSLNIPFIAEDSQNNLNKKSSEVISEIEILKALKNEILGESIDIPQHAETPALHHPKLSKVTDKSQFEADKKKRISLENYKRKTVPVHKGIFLRQAEKEQAKLLSKALTPRECERFSAVLKGALDEDGISDEEIPRERLSVSPQKSDNDMGPKSPEIDVYSDSNSDSPIMIPSDPVENNDNTSVLQDKKEVDMRVQTHVRPADVTVQTSTPSSFPSNFKNPDFPGHVNYKEEPNPKSVVGQEESPHAPPSLISLVIPPPISGLTKSRVPQLNPKITPSIMPLRDSSMTPSRILMTPTYAPMFGDEHSGRRHVYAPSDSPEPTRTPLWGDDGSSTPAWDRTTKDISSSMMREMPPTWDNLGGRSSVVGDYRSGLGFCTPRHDPFNRTDEYNRSFDRQVNIQNRAARDPRLCAERKDEPFPRDPRMASYTQGNNRSNSRQNDETRNVKPHRDDSANRSFREAVPLNNNFLQQHANREFSRASSVGRSFGRGSNVRHHMDFDRTLHGNYVAREPNISRHIDRERSVGPCAGNLRSGAFNLTLEPTAGREIQRDLSIGREFRREQSMERDIIQEQSFGREFLRQRSVGREICRERSIRREFRREQSIACEFNRESSIRCEFNRESNNRSDLVRESSIGREFSKELTLDHEYHREPSIGREFRREQSIGHECRPEQMYRREFQHESSTGRDFRRDPVMGCEFRREPRLSANQSSCPDIRREQSISPDVRQKQSLGVSMAREPSMARNIEREKSVSRDLRREPSIGRESRKEPKNRHGMVRERSIHQDEGGGRKSVSRASNTYISTGNDKRERERNIVHNIRRERNTAYTQGAGKTGGCGIDNKKERDMKTIDSRTINRVDTNERVKASMKIMGSNSRDPRRRRYLHEDGLQTSRSSSNSSCQSNHSPSSQSSIHEKITEKQKCYESTKKYNERKLEEVSDVEITKSKEIVYTTDNIAKGKILSQGYGVKNYKIPKIKRLPEDVPEDEPKENTDTMNEKIPKVIVCKVDLNKFMAGTSDISCTESPMVTVSSKQGGSVVKSPEKKTKLKSQEDSPNNFSVPSPAPSNDSNEFEDLLSKIKLSQVEASSDTDESVNNLDLIEARGKPVDTIASGEHNTIDKTIENKSSPRIGSCESLENIRGKDEDTGNKTPKNILENGDHNSTVTTNDRKEKIPPMEYMVDNEPKSVEKDENITTTESIDITEKSIIDTSEVCRESSEQDSNKTATKYTVSDEKIEIMEKSNTDKETAERTQSVENQLTINSVCSVPKIFTTDNNESAASETILNIESHGVIPVDRAANMSDTCGNDDKESRADFKQPDEGKSNHLEIVDEYGPRSNGNMISSHKSKCTDNTVDKDTQKSNIDGSTDKEQNTNASVPDSTIQFDNAEETILNNVFPDSTNATENNAEANSLVSSSHDLSKEEEKQTPHAVDAKKAQELDAIKSLGSILSVLQDKTKLKHVLNLLIDDSAETEKLKRKLAKLSEMASDDEDADAVGQSNIKHMVPETPSLPASVLASTSHITTSEIITPSDAQMTILQPLVASTDSQLIEVKHTERETSESKKKEQPPEEISSVQVSLRKNNKKITKGKVTKKKVMQGKESMLRDEYEFVDELVDSESVGGLLHSKLVDIKLKKQTKFKRKKASRFKKTKSPIKKNIPVYKRTTRSESAQKTPRKRKNRELEKLQEDIREMFISEGVLNATGIRMCRIAKLTEPTPESSDREEISPRDSSKKASKLECSKKQVIVTKDPKVLIEKAQFDVGCKSNDIGSPVHKATKTKKLGPKPCFKLKTSPIAVSNEKIPKISKPGPKSKKKTVLQTTEVDKEHHVFSPGINLQTDSLDRDVDSDDESLSSYVSTASSDKNVEPKAKQKRKKCMWQKGHIKIKKKCSKDASVTKVHTAVDSTSPDTKIPDNNCFTDKKYCFAHDLSKYLCRLCGFEGEHIVRHFKESHCHVEVPLSRINPKTATEAIEQSLNTDFDAFQRTVRNKMICRFCFHTFEGTRINLEKLFWHIVSNHTGEYKYACTVCPDQKKCSASLDIPKPPGESQELLLGYICGECHYTQISLNNLKTHVALRHDNEETEVYTINLCDVDHTEARTAIPNIAISNKTPEKLRSIRKLRPRREWTSDTESQKSGNETISEGTNPSAVQTATWKVKTPVEKTAVSGVHFTFEGDDDVPSESDESDSEVIKLEKGNTDIPEFESFHEIYEAETPPRRNFAEDDIALVWENNEFVESLRKAHTIKQEPLEIKTEFDACVEYDTDPHFMITSGKEGVKSVRSYVCRVRGCASDFRTPLLIALKRHLQAKHVAWRDIWDGYCCVCKQLVAETSNRSSRNFSDCLNHMLMNHLDEFPIMNEAAEETTGADSSVAEAYVETSITPETLNVPPQSLIAAAEVVKKYISVKPMSDLISNVVTERTSETSERAESSVPRIQSVVSLQTACESQVSTAVVEAMPLVGDAPCIAGASNATSLTQSPKPVDTVNAILSEKHSVIRARMLTVSKLSCLFKCAGRYCGYVSRAAASFVEHVSAHLKLRTRDHADVLRCVYCSWSADGGDALAAHVLREHGHCRYSCPHCWYLATAPILVELHRSCDHPALPKAMPLVLERPASADDASVMSSGVQHRRDVVPFYVCAWKSSGDCHFSSYTAPKYREHLETQHSAPGEDAVKCSVCGVMFSSASSLIAHLKSHGLCLFQCTYCLSGADTEMEMLEHAAAYHPWRRSQAYLRHIIACKETNSAGEIVYKALPLMRLGQQPQHQIPTQEAPSLEQEECPKKEADRAHALERLIVQHQDPLALTSIVQVDESLVTTQSAAIDSTGKNPQEAQNNADDTAPIINIKVQITDDTPKDTQRKKTLDEYVICLDSDEEEERPQRSVVIEQSPTKITKFALEASGADEIIDLSDDETENATRTVHATQELRFGTDKLFKCEKCQTTCRNDYHYRTHIPKCYSNECDCPKCPYCEFVATSRKDIRAHLIKRHGPIKTYRCSECGLQDALSKKLVQHMHAVHEMLFVTVCLESPSSDKVRMRYVVKPEEGFSIVPTAKPPAAAPAVVTAPVKPISKPGPKRSKKQQQPKPKPIRYGPGSVDSLPHNPIFDDSVQCARCDFTTRVRTNMLRHLQMHANEVSVPAVAPVNPVPHLESNEMHFDKMTNLAASSNAIRPSTTTVTVTTSLSAEIVAKYPRYVPDKDRNVCGAVGCSYMSLDEGFLKYHWETLHSGLTHGPQATTWRCVHCPPHQQLDTSRPLTASRIIGHLKMHDCRLYGCGDCGYYHHQLNMVERHVAEKHGADARGVITVREPMETVTPATSTHTPTMDLKAWQCGMCKFKSMLRPEVAEHSTRVHGFKFQFKCTFCPYRGSVQSTVLRHQTERHPGRTAPDVLHVYYKEGTLPADEEGNPLWMKQRSLFDENIKTEAQSDAASPKPAVAPKSPSTVDLALVKEEIEEEPPQVDNLEAAIALYGPMKEPDGIYYLCPLCNITVKEGRELFVTHLHEELKYRRWGCSLCSYKTFSRARIIQHSRQEHKQTGDPLELHSDRGIELWIKNLLQFQDIHITDNKKAMARPLLEPTVKPKLQSQRKDIEGLSDEVLQKLTETYGPLGVANGDNFVCPKCNIEIADENKMYEHLEIEVSKNRYACSGCQEKFQFYQEAQRHCSTGKHTTYAHVISVSKNSAEINQWIECVLRVQRNPGPCEDSMDTEPGSLLVVRYEEAATAPESHIPHSRKRKSKSSLYEDDSDDDPGLSIVERAFTSSQKEFKCPHCDFSTFHTSSLAMHTLRHFNMRPYTCAYCPFSSHKTSMDRHLKRQHPDLPSKWITNKAPKETTPLIVGALPRMLQASTKRDPTATNSPAVQVDVPSKPTPATMKTPRSCPETVKAAAVTSKPITPTEEKNHICLLCERELPLVGCTPHHDASHSGQQQQTVLRGTPVRRCSACMALRVDADALSEHHNVSHPGTEMSYTIMLAGCDTREAFACDHCGLMFTYMRDLKCHHEGAHASLQLQYSRRTRAAPLDTLSNSSGSATAMAVYPSKKQFSEAGHSRKRVARKSTTKLPFAQRKVARKSTTKLPFSEPDIDFSSEEEDKEYSYYGTRPTPIKQFGHIQTKMPFFGNMMNLTVEKLSGIINVSPIVSVMDVKN